MNTHSDPCARCGHALKILSRPLRRLRWTRYWWRGVKSLFTGPLRICSQCGAIYANDGSLLAAGAVATAVEQELDQYRKDMAYLRDSFGGVVIAAELVAVWLIAGPGPFFGTKIALSIAVGVGAFLPYVYFGRKARIAKKDLKALSEVRRSGAIPQRSA